MTLVAVIHARHLAISERIVGHSEKAALAGGQRITPDKSGSRQLDGRRGSRSSGREFDRTTPLGRGRALSRSAPSRQVPPAQPSPPTESTITQFATTRIH